MEVDLLLRAAQRGARWRPQAVAWWCTRVTSDLHEPRGRAHRAREPRGLPRERRGAAFINGDAVVIDGGKMQSGGGGASTQSMLDWTDEQWEAIRPKKK